MRSEGPKKVVGSYGLAGNGRRNQEQSGDHGGRRRRRFACSIPTLPVAVGLEILPA